MNCLQANSISIAAFLLSIGIHSEKQSGNNFWCCSPLRSDREPSFKVCGSKNVWFDYGTSTGGRLIDMVCKMNNVGVPGALSVLSGVVTEQSFIFFPDQQKSFVMDTKIEIKHLQPLQNHALIKYLTDRKINPTLASKFCNNSYTFYP
jgi:DNA primase